MLRKFNIFYNFLAKLLTIYEVKILAFILVLLSLYCSIFSHFIKQDITTSLTQKTSFIKDQFDKKLNYSSILLNELGKKIAHDDEQNIVKNLAQFDLSIFEQEDALIKLKFISWSNDKAQYNDSGLIKDISFLNYLNKNILKAQPNQAYLYNIETKSIELDKKIIGISSSIAQDKSYHGHINGILDLSNLYSEIKNFDTIKNMVDFDIIDASFKSIINAKQYNKNLLQQIDKQNLLHSNTNQQNYIFTNFLSINDNKNFILIGAHKELFQQIFKAKLYPVIFSTLLIALIILYLSYLKQQKIHNLHDQDIIKLTDHIDNNKNLILLHNKSTIEKENFIKQVLEYYSSSNSSLHNDIKILHDQGNISLTKEKKTLLINEIYSKLDNITNLTILPYKQEEIDLSKIIDEIINIYNIELINKKITLNYLASQQVNTIIYDKIFLKQILLSLVSCSINNTPSEGKIEIDANIVRQEDESVILALSVKDNGYGWKDFKIENESYINPFILDWKSLKNIIESIKGLAIVENNQYKGTKAFILIPIIVGSVQQNPIKYNDKVINLFKNIK